MDMPNPTVIAPLHPADRPSETRGEHLARVELPMLFLSGTRDELAELDRLERVVRGLGPRATLSLVHGADHSFRVPARSGRRAVDVMAGLADEVAGFAARVSDGSGVG